MLTLFHHPFCPHSRFIRLALGEYGLELRLVEERAWERREEFLTLNPAGTTPVLIAEGAPAGAGRQPSSPNISTRPTAPECRIAGCCRRRPAERIEVRRLMAWFNEKFFEEVSDPLVTERIYKRFMSEEQGGGAPATDAIRAAKAQCPLSSGLYRLAGADAELSRRRPADLCGPRRGGASVGDRLSGRRAMERRRRSKDLVRAGEIPPVVPSAAERMAGRACRRRATYADLDF